MNQIAKDVKTLLNKYKFINNDNKLVLMYLKEYEDVRWDNRYVSTRDLLNIDMELIQQILDAKYILSLYEESD